MASRIVRAAVLALMIVPALCAARDDRHADLSFEAGSLAGWNGDPSGPAGTVFIDSTVVHGGRFSARIERGPQSPSTFSNIALSLPVDFAGDSVELRGWLRLEGVVGRAGLLQRQDGIAGDVQFDNMDSRALSGTTEWKEFRVVLPLDRKARAVVVGAILTGTGRLWADDLRLMVDGKPLAEAPPSARPQTPLDTDHEFDGGSRLALDGVTDRQAEDLFVLGKLWGYLKYHHPRVTQGSLHWDYELFRITPRVLAAQDRQEARRILVRWVEGLGRVARCVNCAPSPEGRPMVPRLRWLADEKLLGRDLSRRLRHIHANRDSVVEQFYVSLPPYGGNATFVNEPDYWSRDLPDAGYRLLALYRLWNIVEYWFPYRDVMQEDWDLTLREFIPRMLADSTRDEYKLDLIRLIARMHDGHANLWRSLNVRPPVGTCQVPVVLRFIEGRPVVTGFSDEKWGPATGLEIGDSIRSLDGTPVDSLITRWRPFYAASNEAARLRDMAGTLTRGPCDSLRLEIERADRRAVVKAARVPIDSISLRARASHDRPGDTFQRASDDLAYLKLSSVKAADAAEYVRKAAGAKCLLIDIRNYPSEFVVFEMGQHLVTRRTEFARFTHADLSNPGSFRWTDPLVLEPAEPRFQGRVAILVDEVTQSQAEYTTLAFRSVPGALVFGSTTAGADGDVSPIPLPGGISGLMSGIGVFYPDHRPTQRVGIVPDVVVAPTVEGVRAGRDEVLESAVRHTLGREITLAERKALGITTRVTR